MYWNSVSTFRHNLQFQYHSCEEIVYFSRDFSTATFIQYIQSYTKSHRRTSVNSNRCFHCARLESMYWNSVSTYGALLQFQYHSCEEIVYFSRDFSTTFIQYIQLYRSHGEPAEVKPMLSLCRYWNSVSTFRALLQFQYHSCEEIVYFSRDFSTNSILQHTCQSANRCYTDAFIVLAWNRNTEIQYPLLGHFFNFSSTAVKR